MTKSFKIVLKRSVLKDIRRMPRSALHTIQDRIAALEDDPFPPGAESIKGYDHHYRIRIGTYRVIYEVAAAAKIITIIRIAHRKDIYRHL